MADTDNIMIPREVVQKVHRAMGHYVEWAAEYEKEITASNILMREAMSRLEHYLKPLSGEQDGI